MKVRRLRYVACRESLLTFTTISGVSDTLASRPKKGPTDRISCHSMRPQAQWPCQGAPSRLNWSVMKRLLLILVLLLAACAPSGVGQNAVTQAPTADLRIVKADSPLLLMNVTDLPREGKYTVLGTDWTGEVNNQAVLDAWGAEEGGKYIDETGRLDGWWIQFNRTASGAALPSAVYDSVAVYKTVAGARLSVQKYAAHGMQTYTEVQGLQQIGDGARAFALKKGANLDYVLYFSYRNLQHVIETTGPENEATPAFAAQTAMAVLARMQTAPLTTP